MFKVKGNVYLVNDTQQVTEKFKKRTFVLETEGEYKEKVEFQAVQDKVFLLDNVGVGETVEVSFNLKGREWKSLQGEVRFFNTLEAWRIDGTGSKPQSPAQNQDDDDLPF